MRKAAVGILLTAALAAAPAAASAQAGEAILGRAYDAASGDAVPNALVTLEGFGSTLSGTDGAFRFRGVDAGTYTLRVQAFSYATATIDLTLPVEGRVDVALESAPLALDSIVVEAGTVDYHGRVHDSVNDFYLVDAQAVVRGRDPAWTDAHGRFDLDDLPEGVPVSLSVRAFGYLPIDTTFVPDDEERYDFDLEPDAFADALTAVQVRRLDERAGGRLMTSWGLDRREILRYSGSHTALTMMEFNLPRNILRRVTCTFLDERLLDISSTMGKEVRDAILTHVLPEEIERVELLTFDNLLGRPVMMQVYTRSFIAAMATQDVPLRTPTILRQGNGYQCI